MIKLVVEQQEEEDARPVTGKQRQRPGFAEKEKVRKKVGTEISEIDRLEKNCLFHHRVGKMSLGKKLWRHHQLVSDVNEKEPHEPNFR